MTSPRVSLIVPTLDRRRQLERFLCSADAQRDDCYEILVVDQGTDAIEDLAACHRNVRYIRSSEKGLSRNRNLGLRHALGDWLVFADDDCVLAGDYLDALAEAAHGPLEYPNFGFGNAVTLEDGAPVVPTFRAGRASIGSWACDTLCSISLVFGRQAVERAGGFDEEFGLGARFPAAEETDLLLRLCEAGGRGHYCSGLTIRHPRRSKTADLAARYEAYGYAHGALARKHHGNRTYQIRFLYGLARTMAGAALGAARHDGLAALYRASLAGKLRGFRAYGMRPSG